MSQSKPTLFFLGATGYLGSQFLSLLGQDPELKHRFSIKALVRNPTPERISKLEKLYNDITVVEGGLDSDSLIQEQAEKADFVINTASSDHIQSIISTLAGLEKNSVSHPGKPPLYIQISGLGITSDNSRGEYVPLEQIPHYTDIDFDLNSCPPTNTHLDQDKLIVAAGTRKENPVRTIIVFPGWIYGIGEGIQQITTPIRIFMAMFEKCGYAGTWGPGESIMDNAHVKDVANAILLVFKAALEGRADEGAEGLYFAASDAPRVRNREITAKMGDIMFEKDLVTKPGSQPFPAEVVDPLGHYGWSLMGGNLVAIPQRMKKLGWETTETYKKPLLESLGEELELYLRILGKIPL